MSQLDRHVATVRNKLTLRYIIEGLAWAIFIAAALVLLVILIVRLCGLQLPVHARAIWIGLGVSVSVGAISFGIWRRPKPGDVAAAIDEKLNLKEKFSTALYARSSPDPFAQAAVLDAENAAKSVRVDKQFPLRFPSMSAWTTLLVLATWVCWWAVPFDPFHRVAAAAKPPAAKQLAAETARQNVNNALFQVKALPPTVAQSDNFKVLQSDLEQILKQPTVSDPGKANRKAFEALQDVQKALAAEQDKVRKVVDEQNAMFHEALAPTDDKGPVADAQRDLRDGKIDKAADDLQKLADNFAKEDKQEQQKQIQQMQKLANKLQQAANDPKVQQQIQQQLQQMGMNQQQAQQMAQQMQQAAQGNKQAQQQIAKQMQQMQQQVQKQLQQAQAQAQQGNQQAAQQAQQLQQQLQAMQQAQQQAQAAANAQAQANAMAQATQKMQQAMQQQQQAGQQGAQQPGGQQNQQAMQQAQQAMQQALNQVQAAQQDAKQIANAQQQAQQAAQQAAAGAAGQQPGQQGGQHPPGQWGQPMAGQPGQGVNGNNGAGGDNSKALSPFGSKEEQDISGETEKGQILASTVIQSKNEPGHAKLGLQQVAQSALKSAAEEVDEDHVSGQGKKAAEEYFRTMGQQAKQ